MNAACAAVTCPEGTVCEGEGVCVDACEGVVCPIGETCEMGACELAYEIVGDAGVPTDDAGIDAGAEEDAGVDDASADAASVDAGTVTRRDPGCDCGASSSSATSSLTWFTLLGLALIRRRRR